MDDLWSGLNAIATLVLASASVFVAVMSWRTAKRANALTETAQERDRARSRRMVSLEVQEWTKRADDLVKRGENVKISELLKECRKLSERCRVEGEAEGVMLVDAIAARVKAFHRHQLHRPHGWAPGVVALPPWTRRYPEVSVLRLWAEHPEKLRQRAFDALNEASALLITETMGARDRNRQIELARVRARRNQSGQKPVAD